MTLTTHSFFGAAFFGRTGFFPLLCCSGRATLTNDICSQTQKSHELRIASRVEFALISALLEASRDALERVFSFSSVLEPLFKAQ